MTRVLLAIALVLGLSAPVAAQSPGDGNPFSAAVMINDKAITNFEITQRISLLRLFRTPGNLPEVALEALIEDRLRMIAADQQGIVIPEEAIEVGMEEFASRVNLPLESFLSAINAAGVSDETYRDFVEAGLAWREVVRNRFGPRAQVSEAEVDRALALSSSRGGAEALISEIIIPANTPAAAARAQEVAERLSQSITTEGAFAAAARRYSAAPSRGRGGRVANPVALASLPPPIRAQIVTLGPGEVSDPIPIPNAIALFQLRELRETPLEESENISLEYARLLIPGGRTSGTLVRAEKLRNRVDTCDDLYGVNKGQPEELLQIETAQVTELPQDVALELAKLDEGEISTALTQGDAVLVLMLCSRIAIFDDEIDRGTVRERLINQRIASYADGYLAELRADAIIRYP